MINNVKKASYKLLYKYILNKLGYSNFIDLFIYIPEIKLYIFILFIKITYSKTSIDQYNN